VKLRIVTPTRVLVNAEVSQVTAPGTAGEMGILPEHVTFLGQMDTGVVSYDENGKRSRVIVRGGYVEVVDDVVTILADDAEFAAETDAVAARAEVERIREELRRASGSPEDMDRLLEQLKLAETRVSATH
jgi:F-type H+-transporting ATPase subunit epsilon